MNWQSFALKFYRLMLKLYPVDFQERFRDEMVDVFSEGISNSGGQDSSQGWRFILREFGDYPISVLQEHWSQFRKVRSRMNQLQKANQNHHLLTMPQHEPGSWQSAFLAGLPHLLMGLLVGTGVFFHFSLYDEPQSLYMIIAIILAGTVVVTLLAAWWAKWPLWSASWFFYGSFVLLAIIVLWVENLALEGSWRITNALLLGWLAFCILGYLYISTRSKMQALLSIVIFFPFIGSFLVEFIPRALEGFTTISTSILAAITAGTIVRINDPKKGLGILLGVNLLVSLWLAYIGEYQHIDFHPGIPSHIPSFNSFLQLLGLYSGISLGVIALPFLVRAIKLKTA
jgi:hypothetical protein